MRALIFAGRYAEAEQLADAKLLSRPLKQMPYQPLGDLLLDFDRADGISDYRRQLDLDTAVATTTFRSGGAVHRREGVRFCAGAMHRGAAVVRPPRRYFGACGHR